jgi:diguanylate cyclase (GGDEF)-like protein/PAS domain S-box-containing protein
VLSTFRRDPKLRDAVGVPLIVVSQHDDNLAAINTVLREAGHAVHCIRVADPASLEEAIAEHPPELVLVFADEPDLDLTGLSGTIFRRNPPIPVLIVRQQVTEKIISDAIAAGARDVVSLAQRARLQAVVERELRTRRLQAALDGVLSSATQYQQELRNLMKGATEAITDVQEGIVISANPAWLAMLGLDQESDLAGQPFMDLFSDKDQPSLKGALQACLKGKWNDATLQVTAQRRDQSSLGLELRLERVTVDGEPAVRIIVPTERGAEGPPEDLVEQALCKDPSTGFLLRHHFLERTAERLRSPVSGGVRALAYIRPDHFSRVHRDVGLLGTEALIMRLGELLRELLQPNDLCGRFGGTIFTALLERGTMTDAEAWAEQVRKAVAGRVFEVDHQSTTLTCTIGLTEIDGRANSLPELLTAAEKACRAGRDAGGNKIELCDTTSATQKVRMADAMWVPRIRAALMQNRFRLVHQPIASLTEEVQGMFDTLVRMVDEAGNLVLPSEFVPPAERANMIKNVDRWVIGASLSFCTAKQPTLVFVRLSRDSVLDETLLDWLGARLRSLKVSPQRLCFQVSEQVAAQQLRHTKDLAERLAAAGFLFAIDHLGTGRDSAQLLHHVPMQFMKIDGSLMQGLQRDTDQQRKVASLVQVARKLNIRSIAERVEDAKTMAVLWQLGIAYFQGNFVQTRGVVLESAQVAEGRAAG